MNDEKDEIGVSKTPMLSLDRRGAGILLHPTSLPGRFPSGDLGPEAYRFADFLAAAGQTWWQMLPIVPTGGGHSPYSGLSAFAGSALLISPELLVRDGLLKRSELPAKRSAATRRVDYRRSERDRRALLERAFSRFQERPEELADAYEGFKEANAVWLDDFALYATLKRAYRGKPWDRWPEELRKRKRAALRAVAEQRARAIEYERFVQFLFDRQWFALKRYCNERGVGLVGDIPIFVEHDSADVWAHGKLFQLDRDGRAKWLSGTPPDNFSATGQYWGHPLYKWSAHQRENYAWWVDRFRYMMTRFDATRIDHFLGFHRAWHVPAGAKYAMEGHYRLSPGRELFAAVRKALGRLEIIAEDVGDMTEEAIALRDELGFPGLKVMQYGFGDEHHGDLPQHYVRNCVAYTGTHDNHTIVGWFKQLANDAKSRGVDGLTPRRRVLTYTGGPAKTVHWDLLRALHGSVANTTIVPIQDYLGLDDRGRMNTPATTRNNWVWRLPEGALRRGLAREIREILMVTDRVPANGSYHLKT